MGENNPQGPNIFLGRKFFFPQRKMEIVKVKGQPNRFFLKDVKMFYVTEPSWWDWAWRGLKITFRQGEILGRLRKLPKTGDLKRIFYREVNNKKVLCPFPKKDDYARSLPFPRGEFVGDVLLRANNIVENVLLKFVLEGERVIPFNEWLSEIREIENRINEAGVNEGIVMWDLVEQLEERCHHW